MAKSGRNNYLREYIFAYLAACVGLVIIGDPHDLALRVYMLFSEREQRGLGCLLIILL